MNNLIESVYAGVSTSIINPLPADRFTSIGSIFGFVVNLIIGIGWALVFVMLALGFVQYVTSRGEKTAVDNAQKWLTYAVIGGVGLFFISFLKTQIPALLTGNDEGIDPGGNLVNF